MKDLILRLRDEGKTILMCSHLLADVQDVCDRIAILHQGELKELGRVDSLLKVRDVTEIRTSGLSDEAQAEIRQVVARHQGTVHRMGNPTTTLEELFVHIIRESEAHPGRRVRGVGRGREARRDRRTGHVPTATCEVKSMPVRNQSIRAVLDWLRVRRGDWLIVVACFAGWWPCASAWVVAILRHGAGCTGCQATLAACLREAAAST